MIDYALTASDKELLKGAKQTRRFSSPCDSHFEVGEMGLVAYYPIGKPFSDKIRFKKIRGYNIEDQASFGQPYALHAEAIFIALARAELRPGEEMSLDVLTISTKFGPPAAPCGHCRKKLISPYSPLFGQPFGRINSRIITRTEDSGAFEAYELEELTPTRFNNQYGEHVRKEEKIAIEHALKLGGNIAVAYSPDAMTYAGYSLQSASYAPISPVDSAANAFHRIGEPDIGGIVIMCDGIQKFGDALVLPGMFSAYQDALEALEISHAPDKTLTVISNDERLVVRGEIEKFLPHPFSLRNLGLGDRVDAIRDEIIKRRK